MEDSPQLNAIIIVQTQVVVGRSIQRQLLEVDAGAAVLHAEALQVRLEEDLGAGRTGGLEVRIADLSEAALRVVEDALGLRRAGPGARSGATATGSSIPPRSAA